MATHASAEKRHRQSLRRNARNKKIRVELRKAIKAARTAIAAKSADAAELARKAERTLAKAASKGIVKKRNAARRTSRLSQAARAAKA